MQAALTPAYGPAELLHLAERTAPTPGPTQVLVEVVASTVTRGDLRLRTADFPPPTGTIGRLLFGWSAPKDPVQGTCFAGRIVEVGPEVRGLAVGDAVFGLVDSGAWAERLVVDEHGPVARIPEGVSFAAAAATPYGAGTAHELLHDLAQVQPGERVLILGGSGGVGRFAVQLARHLGAEVTAVGSAAAAGLMRELGAHHTLDHTTTDVHELEQRYDVVFDIADTTTFSRARRLLRPGGRYLTLTMSLGVLAQSLWRRLTGGHQAIFTISMPDQQRLQTLAAFLQDGALQPTLGDRFPLEAIARAHAAAEHDRHRSPIVEVARPAGAAVA